MTVGVAVIGLGFMGRTHLAGYTAAGDACRHAGVYDANPDRLSGEASAGGNIDTAGSGQLFDPADVFATDSLDDLLSRDDIDAVSICTPTDTHVRIATAALRAGKHVLVEKPVALSVECIETLAAEAVQSGKLCMPAMCIRFWPEWAWLAGRVRDQAFGPLRSLAIERIGSVPAWGDGFYQDQSRTGGALFDLHIHDSDFVLSLLGQPAAVTTVGDLGRMTTVYHYEGDSAVPHVTASGGWMRGGAAFRMRYLAEFEHGTADYDISRTPRLLMSVDEKAEPVSVPAGTGYEHEIAAFVRAIASGAVAPVTLGEAAATTRVLLAESGSMGNRRRVDL